MIRPVSSFNPCVASRGANVVNGKLSQNATNPQIAVLNVCGASLAVGGLTAAIARSHTSSWANAVVLGMFGTFLSLFLMTPQIVASKNKLADTSVLTQREATILKNNSQKTSTEIKKCLKPVKKLVQFGQN